MEEKQVTQNSTSNQPVQQWQWSSEQTSVSMQIQELLVQQQQYQQQYNQLVKYVQDTPNLPIEEVEKIKQQLDQLNALFVEWKQKLQTLWYNPVQVNKPIEVKKWSKNNLSFKKLAIWCLLIVVLILIGVIVTVNSLVKNPDALQWIWIETSNAKTILMLFSWLIFWSATLLMIWVVIWSIYKLVTVKNGAKGKNVLWLFWWVFGASIFAIWLALMLSFIGKIQVAERNYDVIQLFRDREYKIPYRAKYTNWDGTTPDLIAPMSMYYWYRKDVLSKQFADSEIEYIVLVCWNQQWQELKLGENVSSDNNIRYFNGGCLYGEKWEYTYSYRVKYKKSSEQQRKVETITGWTLDFQSEFILYDSKNKRIYPTNGEFIVWEAPVEISINSRQVFRDFSLDNIKLTWDWGREWNEYITDKENVTQIYNTPQVYYPSMYFPDILNGTFYTFPIRVEQSPYPVCELVVENHPWTTKYNIEAKWMDESSRASIASYNYSIIDLSTNKEIANYKNASPVVTHEFPERWTYKVRLDFVTTDRQQSYCATNIQLKPVTFNIEYSLSQQNASTLQYEELCSSTSSSYSKCTQFSFDSLPQHFQLEIKSITPSSNTIDKTVYFNNQIILKDNSNDMNIDTYSFDIYEEWTFNLKVLVSDKDNWIEEEQRNITFTVKKPDIIWHMTLTSKETWQEIKEWFEPLTVILDASKTEINIPGDEIVYFTWDFWDGEVKRNQQNWVIQHTYNFDYTQEKWIFSPKVTITTLQWLTKEIVWPKINVKKWLVDINLTSPSHPTRQIKVGDSASFQAEFDWLPETMIWDFWDGSYSTECPWRACTEVEHVFTEKWLYSVKLSLNFDAIQEAESVIEVKVY